MIKSSRFCWPGGLLRRLVVALGGVRPSGAFAKRPGRDGFQTIVGASPLPINISQIRTGRILFANAQSCLHLGVPLEKLLGRDVRDFYVDPQQRQDLVDAVLQTGLVGGREIQIRREGGRSFWALAAATLMTYEAEPAIFVSYSDLSEVKAQQRRIEELMAHEKALTKVLHLGLGAQSLTDFVDQSLDCLAEAVAWISGSRCLGLKLEGGAASGVAGTVVVRHVDAGKNQITKEPMCGRAGPCGEEACSASIGAQATTRQRFPIMA
ncbi:MAG TPA: PAS domain-containing protein, partial [Rhodospirillaceae bacterium]|nr:PAS domain-containing protein [Rhodospirillaceae bacterium]